MDRPSKWSDFGQILAEIGQIVGLIFVNFSQILRLSTLHNYMGIGYLRGGVEIIVGGWKGKYFF